jgi:hypothetical protein
MVAKPWFLAPHPLVPKFMQLFMLKERRKRLITIFKMLLLFSPPLVSPPPTVFSPCLYYLSQNLSALSPPALCLPLGVFLSLSSPLCLPLCVVPSV